ncbi:MarP family serine protease [Streptomyces albireticuli]|uniref:Serine protease n=1 Tax=Streptomyces albireticuli TaxID=1940 RepID=A0A2A2DEU1_9ACTN|nr:MarP family serine protease [Streptomyces albireticuli]MCD9144473.1 MarP family serine protease [Streptomyces albireticuli]MCD9163464.1 MarP family serine protease [Streptomyces albireticuli]MCD9193150.1 MarP family serine protease [Streptomyces albireticuli]PAU49850.1 serine protease [Streptomyces albireticuli]
MNLLDVLLMLVVVAYAVSGFRRGLVAGVVLLAGFLGGAVLGVLALPYALEPFTAGTSTAAVVAVLVVLLPAAAGHALAGRLAWQLRRRLTWAPVRGVDGIGGAAVNSLAVLLVGWVAASVLVSANSTLLTREIKDSTLLGAVQKAMPEQAPTWFSRTTDALSGAGFPQVFNPFENEPATGVAKPSGDAVTVAATRAARESVVKVEGVADVRDGRRGQEGSGFVYASRHVMTNAHVVAGVSRPTVKVGGVGKAYPAKVVLFDPKTDVAVLNVPGLDAPVLPFDKTAKRGDAAVVAGFPENGGLDLRAATVANEVRAKGQDIYGDGITTRTVYSVRSTVRPGNSGGPLLTPTGKVYGVVFARSTADTETGYVLTADQVAEAAARAATATTAVDTGSRAAL